jgi:hypothetical protein
MIVIDHAIGGAGHKLDEVSMSFRYIAGYAGPDASIVQVLLLDAATNKPVGSPLYTSPPLGKLLHTFACHLLRCV